MDTSHLAGNVKKLISQRNIFIALTMISTCSVVMLSSLLLLKRERTILVPLNGATMWIGEGSASATYLEKMGLYLSDLLLTRSPADVEQKNKLILQHVHPKCFYQIGKILAEDKEKILAHNQSIVFQSDRSYIEQGTLTFVTEGEKLVLVRKDHNAPVLAQQDRCTYRLGFKIENGRPLLVTLKKQ